MSTLVTGGTGLIGLNVVRRLIADGNDVVVLDRMPPPAESSPISDVADRVKYISGSVTDLAFVLNTVKENDVRDVIHMAAIQTTTASLHPIEALQVNVMGTANIFEAARITDLRRVVVMSSSAVMGAPDDLVTPRREDQIVLPATGIYPLSKLTIEQLTHTYRALYGVDATSIRPRTVYGPGTPHFDHPVPVGLVVEAACRGEDIIRETGSDTQFDLTYVKDEAQGIVKALKSEKPLTHHVYNVSFGTNVSMGSVVGILRGIFPDQKIEIGPGLWAACSARANKRVSPTGARSVPRRTSPEPGQTSDTTRTGPLSEPSRTTSGGCRSGRMETWTSGSEP